ncbi:uncharacterized protein BDZ99DRAFT_486568 [Mytilinidion resinicola]|uniref:Prion-inhibition and propagation HeLo domain-containing protein n=1 Tax=Mytilinidion resinicola TaxID=574789 RepID=A0A6A6YWX3_9PEZI|nr:uncharacterized protein BDZ99DRAFT_486568 [Mytilinidion resinicola]KAF2813270.1 hypothetical protein BDZ99DRAFT_486568 [Mytilinidion resinicola]
MIDPLSLAGLTIAVLEQLWKLGEKTAELETRRIQNVIKDENNRTRALRLLLFESAAAQPYGGQTLFDQFDGEIQNQIQIFLEELVGVIEEAYQILKRRHGSLPKATAVESQYSLVKPSNISRSSTLVSWKSSDLSLKSVKSVHRWRWTLLDKKRVATVIRNFSSLNDRIHDNIKLWCLSTSIGVDLQHLKRLEDDENSKKLGFDLDAKLHLASADSAVHNESMELRDRSLFSIFDWDGVQALVEYRKYAPEASICVDLDDCTKGRVEHLARLLHQPKEQIFRTLSCKGWIRDPLQNQIAFVFTVPNATGTPCSLLRAINTPGQKPMLGQKFRLAHELSRCISQLQLVKWVHESFRRGSLLNPTKPDRPEVDFSNGIEDICPSRDVYRHPERQRKPTRPFSKIHDIYALGVVLLEIGLWQSAVSLDKDRFERVTDPMVVQRYLIRQVEKHLESRMGERYKTVVLKCLCNDFGVVNDTKDDMKLQQAFRTNVIDVLSRAADNV